MGQNQGVKDKATSVCWKLNALLDIVVVMLYIV